MLEVFDPTKAENQRERIIIYGRAGIGKTRLALSLPEKLGDILYYAAEDNSEFLSSISNEKRKRVKVIRPDKSDPIRNFQQFCIQDWRTKFPSVTTLVVDSYSEVAEACILHAASTGAIDREPHYRIGDSNEEGGIALPHQGDYQGIIYITRNFLDTLFDKQRHMNIIFICRETSKIIGGTKLSITGKDGKTRAQEVGGKSFGGPDHPGKQMMEELPARFSTVIRLIREPVMVPGMSVPEWRVIAITDNDGQFVAKVRESDEVKGNSLGRVILDKNSENFWRLYFACQNSAGEIKLSVPSV